MSLSKPRKSGFQKLFPSTNVAAYYDQFSQLINLSSFDATDYATIDLANPTAATLDRVALYEHELTHWLDHISTLWGQDNLVMLFNALNAKANLNENDFWRIKSLDTKFNKDIYFDYYTEEYSTGANPIRHPWQAKITSGYRFSSEGKLDPKKPILFIKFSSLDGIPLIRVPISVASILESNAIWAEFELKLNVAINIKDVVERKTTISRIEKEWRSILYDKDYTLYTAIAHLTANLNSQSDIAETYRITSSIGAVTLNLPDKYFAKLKRFDFSDASWNERGNNFIADKDLGFCYFNMLKNLIAGKGKNNYSIENLLEANGLPTRDVFEQDVIHQMEKNISLLIEGPFHKTAKLSIQKGIAIFRKRGIDAKRDKFRTRFFSGSYFPDVMYGDTFFDSSSFQIEPVIHKLNENHVLSLEEKYWIHDYFDGKFKEFVLACGI